MQFHALVKTVIYCIDPIFIKIIIQPLFSDLFGQEKHLKQQAWKIFKHYKLKPSFQIIKNYKT